MQFTDEQNAAAVVAALEHAADKAHLMTAEQTAVFVQVILDAIPESGIPSLSAPMLAGMGDVYRGLMEIASGIRRQAIEAGFEPEVAQMMAANTYSAMMVGATGVGSSS